MRVPNPDPCPFNKCDGYGHIITDDDRTDPCACYRRRELLAYLGTPFKCVKEWPRKSVFWIPGKTKEDPPVDLTKTDLFIRSEWVGFVGGMGFALGALWLKGTPITFDFLYDSRIPDIHFGKESYNYLSKQDREVTEYHNTIDSFGDSPDLLVLRLGMLGAKHKSLGPLILRLLKTREANAKVTWVVEDPQTPYAQGLDPAFDPTVDLYLEKYQRICIAGAGKEVVATDPVYSVSLDYGSVSEEEYKDLSKPSYPNSSGSDDLDIDGCGPKKKPARFNPKKRYGG